ncbi:NUDIX hydrolase [Nocardia asteroides]|uniref:NUDIX hydrolase n=1 Tax=Nocardia asteroides TaxID=1824 RepID=UPI001E65489F|nr:NUDIX hydrolase [Nocardia asteroides]UGT63767.1 NUDIX hydrolase [Nocardia asteroides]
MTADIHAAGAVLWRPARASGAGEIEIALVHRPKYRDWSLPKGKLEPGESPVLAAVREVTEETGVRCVLGRYLGHVTYPVPGHRRLKRVDYWAAEARDGEFGPNDEVDDLVWHSPDKVMRELSYPMDRQVLRTFGMLPPRTSTLLLVRHAKAGQRGKYAGPDRERPLEPAGAEQALTLVPNLLAFGARQVFSADPVRCVQTVAPLADSLGVDVGLEPALSEDAYAVDPAAALTRIRELVSDSTVRVVCSQGKVIPHLMREWAAADGLTLPPARNRKGSVWVLSFVDGRMVAADHLDRRLYVDSTEE